MEPNYSSYTVRCTLDILTLIEKEITYYSSLRDIINCGYTMLGQVLKQVTLIIVTNVYLFLALPLVVVTLSIEIARI